jgi:hypothetical protein
VFQIPTFAEKRRWGITCNQEVDIRRGSPNVAIPFIVHWEVARSRKRDNFVPDRRDPEAQKSIPIDLGSNRVIVNSSLASCIVQEE